MRTARSYGVGLSVFRSWPSTDRAMALALQIHEDGLCTGCGQPMDECMDPASARAYEAPEPTRCNACTARDRRAEDYAEASAPSALRFPVYLRPDIQREWSVKS